MSCPGVFSSNKCYLILCVYSLSGLEHFQVGKPTIFWWKERARKHPAWCPWYIWNMLSIKPIISSAIGDHKLWPSYIKHFEGWPSTHQDSKESFQICNFLRQMLKFTLKGFWIYQARTVMVWQWLGMASISTHASCLPLTLISHKKTVLSNPTIWSLQNKHF